MANKLAREKATNNLLDNLLRRVEFVTKPPNSVFCMICGNILKRPLQISCGHRCCTECEKDIKKGKDGTRLCPVDKELIEYQFPDVSALTELMNLTCFCIHRQHGCPWQGALLLLEDHLDHCDHRADLPCKFQLINCDFVGSKTSLEEHLKKENVIHNALFATYLSDTMEKLEQSLSSMGELSHQTKTLDTEVKRTNDSVIEMSTMLEETKTFVIQNGLESDSLRDWQRQIEQKLESLSKTEIQVRSFEAQQLISKIKQQQKRLQSMLLTKPDLNSIISQKNELDNKISNLNTSNDQHSNTLRETDLKVRLFQAATFDGHYIWKLDNLKNRMLDTSTGRITELYTPPLYTSKYGYKFSAKVALYGDPKERSEGVQYIALYIVIMKGDYDEILDFPFPLPITITLRNVSKKSDIRRRIIPDDRIFFQRPFDDMNPAIGFAKFVSHDNLYSEGFVKDDTIYVELKIEDPK